MTAMEREGEKVCCHSAVNIGALSLFVQLLEGHKSNDGKDERRRTFRLLQKRVSNIYLDINIQMSAL